MKIELVKWLDASSSDGWHTKIERSYAPCVIYTVGFVVWEDDVLLVLASTVAEDQMHNNRSKILKCGIIERKQLRLPSKLDWSMPDKNKVKAKKKRVGGRK